MRSLSFTSATGLMARTRARSTSSSESDATSGEDEEGERAADTGARDPPFHISSLLSPSSSFSSKQKRQRLLLSAGRACGEKERTHGGDLKERANSAQHSHNLQCRPRLLQIRTIL